MRLFLKRKVLHFEPFYPPFYLFIEHKAYKDRGTGKSWFITTLCKVFQQNADSSDLMSMITEVNRLMADQVGYWNEQWVVQIGENRNNLRKHLYFRPLQTWTQYKSEQLQ